ncbi:calumenin-B [Exaiptasia diaphana]|uniref:Reticulocalbin-3 n=1 Tax=Exaiptasia diaphana TaxID=2652724 RepID=A0A913Y6M9_EXADI|nr:calumenin-B [Exaiptasia diaphana]KXJ19691.1 Calumenin-B [Exaiptasia diaphana]
MRPYYITILLALAVSKSQQTVEPHRDHLYQHDHYKGSEHDVRYDHDAFLGPDAQKFEEFPPEESKLKLKIIVTTKIDTNKDSKVSLEELEAWIERQRKAFMYEAIEKNIKEEDKNGDGKISWEEYKAAKFGEWDNNNLPQDHNLRRQIQKAQHKFSMADEDKDGKMDSDEYVNFQHPEETKHMEELAVDEILEDVDQNGDGFITIKEFLGQYGDVEKTPGWVEREREEFARQFDKNKDGKLNREEVRDWALPQRGESLDEAKHLIDGSDDDADGILSLEEILIHWEMFVGSKATDHGETLRQMNRVEL